jgi:serine/threonine protein kinase
MAHLQGYTLTSEQTTTSPNCQLFFATDAKGDAYFLKRFIKNRFFKGNKIQALNKFKRVIDIQKNIETNRVLKAIRLTEDENYCDVLFSSNQCIHNLLTESQNHNIHHKLNIAINICQLVDELHSQQFIINHITPYSLYVSDNCEVTLVDFDDATKVSAIKERINSNHLSRQQLMTISPEATGRMNRVVDQQSDLYSLGTTLFQLFCGRFPFEYDDELELIHAHIAKKPRLANEYNTDVPEQLSLIFAKLLHKSAENRYKTAKGLLADLEFSQQQLTEKGAIALFPLALFDYSNKLVFSQKIFGREKEQAQLLKAFEEVDNQQRSQLCVISGYSGIGKSRLVQEIHQPISEKQGYFISGKFEQYKKSTAYFALIKALTEFVEQLLGENEQQLAHWQNILRSALGENSQLIVELIPEFGLILGESQPPSDQLNTENMIRFDLVIISLFKAISQQGQVLSIFLDDMQWADLATINLIEQLIEHPEINQLFILISYRSNEVNATHPLNQLLDKQHSISPERYHSINVKSLTIQRLLNF